MTALWQESAFASDPIVQVAGVMDVAEANMLLHEGVDWLGFPLRLPVNEEDTSEEEAAKIIEHVGDRAFCVAITYLDDAKTIAEFCLALGVRAVQLHGDISAPELQRLRRAAPWLCVIKSLIVRRGDNSDLRDLITQLAPDVDAFITDTFDSATGACGATGKTHEWSISRALVTASPKPVILAGGLNAANVAAAIDAVKPAGVDVHTGVEGPDGRKDPLCVHQFVAAARRALRHRGG